MSDKRQPDPSGQPGDLVAFYGTLMSGMPARAGCPDLSAHVAFVEPCLIAGRLLDAGPFPALVAGRRIVRGELWRATSERALCTLDDWEECDPGDPAGSLYVRAPVTLLEPRVVAWVYLWNRPVHGLAHIVGGNWRAHEAAAGART